MPMTGDTGNHEAAAVEVDLADNKITDGMLRQRTPHAADLLECGKTSSNSGLDMCCDGSTTASAPMQTPRSPMEETGRIDMGPIRTGMVIRI